MLIVSPARHLRVTDQKRTPRPIWVPPFESARVLLEIEAVCLLCTQVVNSMQFLDVGRSPNSFH